jgi:hypothetical protein
MSNNFFKKLNEAKTAPEGNVYVRANVKSLIPSVNLDDATALKNAGWCYHQNTPEPKYTEMGNYTKTWRNNGDVRVGEDSENKWDFDWEEIDLTSSMTTSEIEAQKTIAFSDLRHARNIFLRKTDWWELPSQAPMSTERTNYRQALRDLPANTTDPFNVTWPTPPEDIDH